MADHPEPPSSLEMRWPALVALDEAGGPVTVLDLLDRVCDRLVVPKEERSVTAPGAERPLVLVRLAEALTDLWNADAVATDESGALAITGKGRRMTEEDVVDLPSAPRGEEQSGTGQDAKPGLWNYVRAILESLPGHNS